jgi:hypothetical protein
VDVITYDDLLRRLGRVLEQLKLADEIDALLALEWDVRPAAMRSSNARLHAGRQYKPLSVMIGA